MVMRFKPDAGTIVSYTATIQDIYSPTTCMFVTTTVCTFISTVVHIAAIPDIEHNAPHTIFSNNINATFNIVEACVQLKVPRLVNISSEQVYSAHDLAAKAKNVWSCW